MPKSDEDCQVAKSAKMTQDLLTLNLQVGNGFNLFGHEADLPRILCFDVTHQQEVLGAYREGHNCVFLIERMTRV